MDSGPVPLERLSEAGKPPAWIKHEHEARYQWAAPLAAGKAVVDVACGTGYGAPWLVEAGAVSVDGFDLDPESIEEANRLHSDPRIRFEVADGTKIPAEDDTYDLYLSFETIEHIEDDHAYLREAVRVLKPGGVFLCSTPNRIITNPGTTIDHKPFNPHHIREYSRPQLDRLLSEYFPSVEWMGQTPRRARYVDLLAHIGMSAPMLAVRLHQARKLLGLPWEKIERHWPAAWPTDGTHEVLLARCRLSD